MEKPSNFDPITQNDQSRQPLELTRLGKEIIPVELVGQNASYQILQQSKKASYPRGDEVRYSDDYLSRINYLYPLGEIVGSRREGIVAGKWNDLNHFTMGSPLQNSEGEQVLNHILYSSAHAGLWQPQVIDISELKDTKIKTSEEYLDAVARLSPRYNERMIDGGVIFGISVAQRGGLVLPTRYESKVIVIPSQKFIEHCIEQNK